MPDEKSANEVVVKSGRVAVLDGVEWEVRDASAKVVHFDFLTESRVVGGAPYISLGSASVDFANQPVIEIHTRLRMDIVTAQVLHTTLGNLIRQAQQPPDKSVAN